MKAKHGGKIRNSRVDLPPLPPTAVDLSDNTYGKRIYFFWKDAPAMQAWLKKAFGIKCDEDIDQSYFISESPKRKGPVFWTFVRRISLDPRDVAVDTGVVAHECAHLTEFVLSYVGIEFHDKTSEAYSYLLENLYNRTISASQGLTWPPSEAAQARLRSYWSRVQRNAMKFFKRKKRKEAASG